jgi:hypothetical protein
LDQLSKRRYFTDHVLEDYDDESDIDLLVLLSDTPISFLTPEAK